MAAEDEKLPLGDAGLLQSSIPDERPRGPDTGLEVALDLGEERFEPVEVLALVPISDLVCDALVRAGADVAKLGDARAARRTLQLGREIIDVDVVGRQCTVAGLSDFSSPW